MKKQIIGALLVAVLCGCAALQPGADPIVVRTEQTISVAYGTFDTFTKLDNDNRDLFKTKIPAVHQFAEWLRVKVGQPPTPRGISLIESANRVKVAYKSNRTPENKANLVTALASLESIVAETQKQLVNAHNP